MMAQKHLHELLEEDQEPFILKNYIADKRSRLQKPSPTVHLQIKPVSQSSNFPSSFCNKARLYTPHDRSPELMKKSPLFEAKTPNSMFLLEAALRIHNQSSSKTKSQNKNSNGTASGLFGSILKRLKHRGKKSKVSVKDILRCEMGVSSSFNEEKSMDMDLGTSCIYGQSMDFEEILISNGVLEHNSAFEKHFSLSPFHFVPQTTPSPSRRERESLKRLKGEEEHCSPVSVLDRPFEDDDRHVDDEDDDSDNGAKQQFLQKLGRFAKLAESDPMEKRMLEQKHDDVESCSSQSEMNIDGCNLKRVPDGMKRLVSELNSEEETASHVDKAAVAERRVDSWRDAEGNTIDMMVEQYFRRDWNGNEEQIRETAMEVESAILGLLMQELIEELVFCTGG